MADDIADLEREIVLTRARLRANIATLSAQSTVDELKSTFKSELRDVKSDALEMAKNTGADLARQGYETLKQKAVENPAAALMIGAGLGWKLWKNPPVAAALAGVGLFSLFSSRQNDPLRSAAHFVRDSAQDAASATMDAVVRTSQDLQAKAGEIADAASATVDAVVRKSKGMPEMAVSVAASAQGKAQEFFNSRLPSSDILQLSPSSDAQRQILMSVAGAAVAAAVGLAIHRFRTVEE